MTEYFSVALSNPISGLIENRSDSSRKYSRKKRKRKLISLLLSQRSDAWKTCYFVWNDYFHSEEWGWPWIFRKESLPSVSNIFYGFNHHVTVINRDGGAVRFSYFESKQAIESNVMDSCACACASHAYIVYTYTHLCIHTYMCVLLQSIARGIKRWYSLAAFSLFQRRLLHRHALVDITFL